MQKIISLENLETSMMMVANAINTIDLSKNIEIKTLDLKLANDESTVENIITWKIPEAYTFTVAVQGSTNTATQEFTITVKGSE